LCPTPAARRDRAAPLREEGALPYWRGGSVSLALHGITLGLVLFALSIRTPPEPAALPAPVAMVFAPATAERPKLPEAVPTPPAAAPPALAAASPAEPLPIAPEPEAASPSPSDLSPAPRAAPSAPVSAAAPEEALTARPLSPPPPLPARTPPSRPPAAAPRKLATAAPFHPTPAPASGQAANPAPPQPAPAPGGAAAAGPAHPPASPPQPLSALVDPAPDYPQLALRRREQGDVILRVVVGPDGLPQTVAVERSSGHPDLDRAAVEAVQRWRFRPATEGGMPVTGTARVPIHFVISN
jgi:protein TonB